ncbi:hypothetical protein TEA_029330 [Camellia sinensis var. sinensis]|uniref:Uncharacterized protein n=1 Tax=Camellia sinensis var. sinensis TaxID=542762 RepID=A0A4S4ES71_CAMSN|nr:hypothetical protein TEA_029330 [Camellia sinensis var. sinensis]
MTSFGESFLSGKLVGLKNDENDSTSKGGMLSMKEEFVDQTSKGPSKPKCGFINLDQLSRFLKDMKVLLLEQVYVVNVLGYIAYNFVIGAYSYWGPKAGYNIYHMSEPDSVFEGITIVSEILGTIARGFVPDKMTNTIPNAFKYHALKTQIETYRKCIFFAQRERQRERDGVSSLIHCSGLLSFPSLLSVLPKALSISGPKAAIALDGKERPVCQNCSGSGAIIYLDFIKENGKCVQSIFVPYWYTCMIPDL